MAMAFEKQDFRDGALHTDFAWRLLRIYCRRSRSARHRGMMTDAFTSRRWHHSAECAALRANRQERLSSRHRLRPADINKRHATIECRHAVKRFSVFWLLPYKISHLREMMPFSSGHHTSGHAIIDVKSRRNASSICSDTFIMANILHAGFAITLIARRGFIRACWRNFPRCQEMEVSWSASSSARRKRRHMAAAVASLAVWHLRRAADWHDEAYNAAEPAMSARAPDGSM